LAEVASVYPERNEALLNAGVLAMTREYSTIPGHGTVVGHPTWYLRKVSQEHGTLSTSDEKERVDSTFKVGDKVLMHVQHACIVAASHPHHYVVDENDVVTEVWYPWKWW
jgi:D-serine ammonia-lyase